MKTIFIYIVLSLCCLPALYSQTLAEAKALYLKGEYAQALPVFEAEYAAKPKDANINQWYGVCLYETGGDIALAEKCLLVASQKKIQDSFYYLGQIYTDQFRFTEAEENFDKYESLLKKKDDDARARLEERRKYMSRMHRVVSNTEDIQIIDSMVVNKSDFLSAYKLSLSSGRIDYFNKVFTSNKPVDATVYFNEKETKIYYSQPDKNGSYSLYSMEKLLDEFGNEKKLSPNNFNLTGDINYPYMMTDGVTIYFAAKDYETLGGYDLFVSRYNMNNDTYLAPERLNMPFNSVYNDYMMVVDEEKNVGWFASDRFQPEGKVCVYTFIPNNVVKIVQSEDEKYVADRARITSIKDSWAKGQNYSQLIALARKAPKEEVKVVHDFVFVINDANTYYKLADFKNKTARDTYYRVVQMKSDLKSTTDKLNALRDTYSKASAEVRRTMATEILDMERKQEQLRSQIQPLEMQARNQEIQNQ
ncbi:tetratricopeptide repeat protein [Prevotella sp. 10(H)]|uniref:tetratricopeptide repeat protein n=1 Tax=Prevotella sp. 10(H) TaxID=1158294 RepID=UPI0004A73BA6|nr:tetratricopeptide repeat protein [Prevotella sp. 10(H)]